MQEVLNIITSYPVAIYTTLLVFTGGFWLLTVAGLFDIDVFDFDIDTDVSDVGGALGVLVTLGLTGVPITIVISLLVLNAWLFSSLAVSFLSFSAGYSAIIDFAINSVILVLAFAIAIPTTATIIKPLKRLFKTVNQGPTYKTVIGKECRVRSSIVNQEFGEVECMRDGASLLLNVRSANNEQFTTGDIVVIVDHHLTSETYIVVSQKEFNEKYGV